MDNELVLWEDSNYGKTNTSTQCSIVESITGTDYTNEFTTQEIFKSREKLCEWIQEAGKRIRYVIVIKTSDAGCNGRRARVVFACERSGHYRDRNRNRNKERKETKRRKRETGTKKCGCPFELKGHKLEENDDWMLKVICGVHNHSAMNHLEGHPYPGRLSKKETTILVDMLKSLIRPKEILVTLKQRDPLSVTTIKMIYNARQRHRVIERARRSQMQQLMNKLSKHKYIEWHRSCNKTEIVIDLFWALPSSVDLLNAFPHVLIMDCTYKTNRYRLPLLEIVGITSTNMSFHVAFAYLQTEREEKIFINKKLYVLRNIY